MSLFERHVPWPLHKSPFGYTKSLTYLIFDTLVHTKYKIDQIYRSTSVHAFESLFIYFSLIDKFNMTI